MKLYVLIGILILLLLLRLLFFYGNQPQYKDGQYVSFETTLLNEPNISGRQQRLSANLASGKKVFINIPLFPEFHYGNSVRISGILQSRMLNNKNAILIIQSPKIEAIKNVQSPLLALTSFVRQHVIYLFQNTLPPTSSSLLLGIVFGIKENMPKNFAVNLRSLGIFHVVAASGMNVTMVGGFLIFVFGLFLRRQIAILLSIFGIILYAVLAGLEASILRASIMGSLVFVAQMIGRQNLASYSLFLTGFAMLFVSPNLINDIGFQLSFMATVGLLYLKPYFDKSILGKAFGTTIAAQVATLPILLANFGTYSLLSILVNALVLWTIPILMIIGSLGAMIGLILQPFGQFILYFSLPFLLYFEKIVDVFALFPGLITIATFPWQLIAGYYSLLLAFLLKRR